MNPQWHNRVTDLAIRWAAAAILWIIVCFLGIALGIIIHHLIL